MADSFPVGSAPWETGSVAPASSPAPSATPQAFPVGSAPWEQSSSAPAAPASPDGSSFLPQIGSFLSKAFGNPVADIQGAGESVYNAITGQGDYAGQNPIERGFGAASDAASAIPEVAADVIPGGKPALNAVSDATQGAINVAANVPNTLADTAVKLGIMTPELRLAMQNNDASFADTPIAKAIGSAATVGNSAGNIANVLLAAHGVAEGTSAALKPKPPPSDAAASNIIGQGIESEQPTPEPTTPAVASDPIVQKVADEIKNIENKYSPLRDANSYSKDGGEASRQRIASSGVLRYTVDQNGLLRTTDPGGAVDQYKAMTVDPAEGVVRSALEQEGNKVNLSEVKPALLAEVQKSGLTGARLMTALHNVDNEMAGLQLAADPKGYVPTTLLHDAKIDVTNHTNYQTPPEVQTYNKALARAYKGLVEDNSDFNVSGVNQQLSKFYEDIDRLQRLDGRRVEGGRLGKYSAKITGNIVGGLAGHVLGPLGAPGGAIAGGEAASLIAGKSMANTFNKDIKGLTVPNAALQRAVNEPKPTKGG